MQGKRQKWIQVIIFLCILASPAWGIDIPYTFETADIPIPDGRVVFPEDIDDDGTLLAVARLSGVNHAVIDPGNARKPNIIFTCNHDTNPSSISKGRVTGDCDGIEGFVRARNGQIVFLDFPGADETISRGIGGDNVVGQIVLPLRQDHGGALSYRFKGFRWNRLTNQFNLVDLPIDNVFVDLLAVNDQGKILGRYLIVDLDNNTLESGFFTDDNGTFDFPFPLDFSSTGGDTTFITDINNDGQALLIRRVAGVVKIQIFDDNQLFDITGFPSEWVAINVRGMNNHAQFVGSYAIRIGTNSLGQGIFEFHGFIASPTPQRQVKAKVK